MPVIEGVEYSESYLQESKQSTLVGVTIFFIILEILALFLRQLSKRLGRIRLGWDDVLMFVGLICCTAVNACTLVDAYRGGVGLHEARVLQDDPTMLIIWGKMIIIIPIIYCSAVVPAKLAVLHLYLHVFTDKRMRFVCWVVVGVILGNWLGTTISGIVACRPISYFWTQEGTCFNVTAFFRWSGLPNILTDVAMLILPLPMIHNLQTTLRMKFAIALTFTLGSIGCIFSIIRVCEFWTTNAEVDGTWSAFKFVVWSVAESGTYQVAACLPLYRPLFKAVGAKLDNSQDEIYDSNSDSKLDSKQTLTQSSRHDTRSGGRFQTLKGSNVSMEEEDGLRLVSLGDQRSDSIAPGTIRVDHNFMVT